MKHVGLETPGRFGAGKQCQDSTLVDRHREILLHLGIGLHRDSPAGADQCIDTLTHYADDSLMGVRVHIYFAVKYSRLPVL